MVFDEQLEIFDGLETVGLEYRRLSRRVRDQVLRGGEADLRAGMGDEADELSSLPC